MRPTTNDSTEDDPRVMQAARDYLAELEAGRKPDRQAYCARYPELAAALVECFDGIDLAQALRPTVPPPQPEYPANPLGDFQILREVGRGGMGVVYEAVQLSLGRRVALKVLPFAAALDAKHLQRFKTEAHAAAQLHHTNIVPVYAVGCERGVHFYAMQLIDGRSLDTVIRQLREDADPSPLAPRERTDTTAIELRPGPTVASSALARTVPRSSRDREGYRTVARIAAQVADALEYAHEAGVVHRDIKPANLLLDAKGTVWVTDFGLAQVAADVSLTQTGDVIGTLRYMSPEQASGQRVLVDHRTDVYSLGATLYEFLTLEPLFSGQDRQTLLHQILNEEPRPPRQVDRSIPVELETIVLKTLAKTPAERYATAEELAADLRRFLDERPILARRPSLVERTRKWMRRHPSFVGAAVLLLVFGLVGLAVTTALVAREQARERQRAKQAEERFQLARRAVDDMIQMANEELADYPHLESLRKWLLEAALVYYQEFIDQRREEPDAQTELEITRGQVEQLVRDLAVLQGAGQIFLLRDPAVLANLDVSDEQRGHLTDLTKRLDDQRVDSFRGFHRLTPDKRPQQFLEMARTNQEAVAAILNPNQLRRLQQIALQAQGPRAFREPEVAATLRLTAEQKERIRALEAGAFIGREERGRPGPPRREPGEAPARFFGKGERGGPKGPPPRGFHEQTLRSVMEKIQQTVLTSEQSNKWKEMTGEPFSGPLPMLFPGRGGPFGRPP
ncbi:MAG: serine/threonine protein kinase [Gemmataceae bacterium]|nr:serine/threonine protein kinase [Gemmataceae bacterium]